MAESKQAPVRTGLPEIVNSGFVAAALPLAFATVMVETMMRETYRMNAKAAVAWINNGCGPKNAPRKGFGE